MEEKSPEAKVLDIPDLAAEIMLKIGSTKSMLCFSAVTPSCLAARKVPSFARRFGESSKPAFVGFLVEFKQSLEPYTRKLRLVYNAASMVEETAVALRPTINLELLTEDSVLCSSHGCLLTDGHGIDGEKTKYYTSFPSQKPRVYRAVANKMPTIPVKEGNLKKNIYGQFGVMKNEGPSGLSFFVKDAQEFFFCSYAGASFCSKDDIYIHVCELVDGTWVRHVSGPIESPDFALFQRNPYSVLHGDSMFLMYLVGYIVCFNLVSKSFSMIYLPTVVRIRTSSWYDYTVCHHSQAGLALVQYWGGKADTWVLTSPNNGGTWRLDSTKNMVDIFGQIIPMDIWSMMLRREIYPLGADHFYTLQVRSASPDAKFVLITLGFDCNLYIVDMMNNIVHQVGRAMSDGLMGHVYPLTEQWPPKM